MRLLPVALVCAFAGSAGAYLDNSLIRREIRAHMREFRACYTAALKKDPKLAGKVTAVFVIGTTGAVVESRASGLPGVDTCVAREISKIKFPPAPKAKGTIQISYPFVFQPR